MKLVTLLHPLLYLKSLREPSNPSETEQESSSGLDNKDQTEDGSASTSNSWLKREHNTLTKYTSGRNTITIRTTSTPPQSRETSSNTTTKTTSPTKMECGSSKEPDLTSLLQSTSRTRRTRKATAP